MQRYLRQWNFSSNAFSVLDSATNDGEILGYISKSVDASLKLIQNFIALHKLSKAGLVSIKSSGLSKCDGEFRA